MAFAVEVPTGDSSTQLGSGVFDYRLIAIAQKALSPRIKLRVNQGLLFAGNTACGDRVLSILAASLVRRFAPPLSLGVELTGARAPGGRASRTALQEQFGGKYQTTERVSIDFGVVFGQLGESPRMGLQVGLSIDF